MSDSTFWGQVTCLALIIVLYYAHRLPHQLNTSLLRVCRALTSITNGLAHWEVSMTGKDPQPLVLGTSSEAHEAVQEIRVPCATYAFYQSAMTGLTNPA